jgi:hypothetical protein
MRSIIAKCLIMTILISYSISSRAGNLQISICPKKSETGTANVRFVKVLSGNTADSWLQISQLVVHNMEGVNVAKNKPTSASSLWTGTLSSTAVDGEEKSRSYPMLFHSNTYSNSWWMVDLQEVQTIRDVVYYNREDCCQNRIVGAKLQLLDSNQTPIAEYNFDSSAPKTTFSTLLTRP